MQRKSLLKATRPSGKIGKRRRYLAASAALVGAALMVSACSSNSNTPSDNGSSPTTKSENATVTYSTFGGSYTDHEKQAWFTPFEAANPGIKIVTTGPPSFGKIQPMVSSGNVTWDVVEIGGLHALANEKDLWTPIDCNVVKTCDTPVKGLQNTKYRVALNTTATTLAYNTKTFATDAPKNWADFFNIKKFPGKRTLPADITVGTLELALLADGVSPSNLYPLDVDRALKKLDTIKSDILWWKTPTDADRWLESGEATMGAIYASRAYVDNVQDKASLAISWQHALIFGTYVAIPKGSPHVAAAMKLIAYITDPANNGKMPALHGTAPGTANTTTKLPEAIQPYLPTNNIDLTVPLDSTYWSENVAAVTKKFETWQTS